LNFRLDLDIEGPQNSMLIEALIPRELSPESPRRSTWIIQPQTPTREQEAKLHIMMDKPALWRVINPNVKGPLGYPVSYEIIPTHAALSLLSPKDYPQRRAGFTDYHLWVTPYNPEERYAGGMYPNQSKGGDGLPSWTKSNRSIENTDIVLWYTIGLHHIVRAEDWPVLPTVWHEFELRPFDFFERNPALDLPK
jgi:primary-amine oxidase